jgi:hypothetical protein
MLGRDALKKLEQLHPLAGGLFILKVDSLFLVLSVPVSNIDPKALVLIETPLDLKPIKTDNHIWMLSIRFLAYNNSRIQ